ncbi:hypothetical protein D3C72_2446090 [compost metagenome]
MRQNLFEHLRMRLATTLVGSPGDIEVILPAIGPQHPIQAAPRLAGSHRQTIALRTKRFQRLYHPLEQG